MEQSIENVFTQLLHDQVYKGLLLVWSSPLASAAQNIFQNEYEEYSISYYLSSPLNCFFGARLSAASM